MLPLTLFAWASFSVPYFLTAYFLGPVFPGLVGAMVGLPSRLGAQTGTFGVLATVFVVRYGPETISHNEASGPRWTGSVD